jgi:hypothetical protein
LVIFCVALVAAMRLRRSLSEGIGLTTEDGRRRTDEKVQRLPLAAVDYPSSVLRYLSSVHANVFA